MSKRSGNPAKAAWEPMRRVGVPPALAEVVAEAWANNLYQCFVRPVAASNMTHLSLKRNDRAPIRDWRHMQQIKNEVCGPDREAVELYPAEERLADAANEYHLWVLPAGERFKFGFVDGLVLDEKDMARYNADRGLTGGKARQRAFQEGLTMGEVGRKRGLRPSQIAP